MTFVQPIDRIIDKYVPFNTLLDYYKANPGLYQSSEMAWENVPPDLKDEFNLFRTRMHNDPPTPVHFKFFLSDQEFLRELLWALKYRWMSFKLKGRQFREYFPIFEKYVGYFDALNSGYMTEVYLTLRDQAIMDFARFTYSAPRLRRKRKRC
jgi:hypothetical protein